MKLPFSIICLLIFCNQVQTTENSQIIVEELENRIKAIQSSSSEFLILCYSMYDTSQDCELRYYIIRFELNLKSSLNSIKSYITLLKLHMLSKNDDLDFKKRKQIKDIFHESYLDVFNKTWNTRTNDLAQLYFSIQSNKIILK